jgi:hypothetical protein
MGKGALIAVLVGLLSPALAQASPVAQITRATTNPEATLGSFAGSVTYDGSGCPGDEGTTCPWIAVLTVQPAAITPPLFPCAADNWRYEGSPSVLVAWASGGQSVNGTVSFDAQTFPILSGVEYQRLCLYLAYTGLAPNYTCAESDPYCPPGVTKEQFVIAASVGQFRVLASGGGGGGGGTGGGGGGSGGGGTAGTPAGSTQQPPTSVLTKAVALSKARKALSRKYGRVYKRGKRRVSCKRRSTKEYRCGFSLRYRKKKRVGTVTVLATSKGVKVTVRSR